MRFSIITPSFRQLDWLRLAIASVRDQVSGTGAAALTIEHFVQDAGSPGIEDFAREVGAEFHRDGQLIFSALQEECYRLVIFSEADEGMYDAVNRGFRRATGEVLAYLNCDEQYLPGALRQVALQFDAAPGMEVIFCDAVVVDAAGRYLCDRPVTIPSANHILVSGNLSVFTAATFSKAGVFHTRNLFFDTTFKNVGDADWVLRLLRAGVPLRTARLRAASFTDTGENLNMQSSGLSEKARLRSLAPCWVQVATPFVVAFHRLKRLVSGAYAIAPHTYEIFTRESVGVRQRFEVSKPSFTWPGR